MSSSSSSDLEDTVRIPTQSGLPNLRLMALFSLPIMRSCLRSPRTIPIFGMLTTAEGLSLCGKYYAALYVLEHARSQVAGRRDFAEALACMALGRINAISDIWDYDTAESELRNAKAIFEELPWSPINELLLLWTTVILADLLTERDPDVIDENAKDLAREAKALLEHCIPFQGPGMDSETVSGGCSNGNNGTTTTTVDATTTVDNKNMASRNDRKGWWKRTKDKAHRKLAWFHFYMWAAVSTTAVFFHTDCASEGLDLTRRLLDVANRREGRSWLTIELQFAVGVFLSSQRDYAGALDAYRTARDWHAEKRLVSGPPTEDDDATSDPLMNYYIAICLSRLGRDAEACEELSKINLLHAVVHDECEFHDDDFDNDLLGLARKTHFNLGQDEAVVRLCERFALVLDEKMGRHELATMANMEDHATALRNLGRLDEVAVVLREMLAREDSTNSWSRNRRVNTAMQLCDVLQAIGEPEEAAYHYRKTLEVLRHRRRVSEDQEGSDNMNDNMNDNTDNDNTDNDNTNNDSDNMNNDNNANDDNNQLFSSDTWNQKKFALVQLARIYERLDRPSEAQTAFAQLQSGFRAAPPTADNVMRYFWYRGRLFASRDKYRLAEDMFCRARDARAEVLASEASRRRRAELEKAKGVQESATEVPPSPASLASSSSSPPSDGPVLEQDECLAAIENGIAAVKAYRQPRLDPFLHDDTAWPLDRLIRPPLFRTAVEELMDSMEQGEDQARQQRHEYAHDPRIEASLREECSVAPFSQLPGSFDKVVGRKRRARGWNLQTRTMQIYA